VNIVMCFLLLRRNLYQPTLGLVKNNTILQLIRPYYVLNLIPTHQTWRLLCKVLNIKVPSYYIMSDSSYKKWQISIFSAFIFVLVIHPYTYQLTQQLFGSILGKIAEANGCPTIRGLILHTLVYILLVRGSMDLKLFSK